MPVTAAGAARTVFLDQHMPDLARRTCHAMIHRSVDQQRTSDAPSQAYVEDYAFTDADALLRLRQPCGICIVINYTRYSKLCREIVLQRKIIPAMRVMKRAYHASRCINQAADRDTHAQNTTI